MSNVKTITRIATSTTICLGIISSGATAFAQDSSDIADIPIETQVESVAAHLVGVMDTSAQANTNPKAPNVRMTTCQIQIANLTNRTPVAVYLYQEQALNNNLTKPYRQRFLQIQPSADRETVESKAYKPQNPENLIGFCSKPERERVIQQQEIGESVCSVFLKPQPNQEKTIIVKQRDRKIEIIYVGETQPQGCPANVRGAVRITNKIILHSQGMDTWDRGYDANGNQVWGAEDSSYQYRWIKSP